MIWCNRSRQVSNVPFQYRFDNGSESDFDFDSDPDNCSLSGML